MADDESTSWDYQCQDCGEMFFAAVWHCPCGGHSGSSDTNCRNCREPRYRRPVLAKRIRKEN